MKKRTIIFLGLLFFFIVAAGAGTYFVYSQKVIAASNSQEMVLEEGQELLYAKITSISGNEMAYMLLEEQTVDSTEMENSRGRNKKASGGDVSSGDRKTSNSEKTSGDRRSSNNEMATSGDDFLGGESFGGGMPVSDERTSGDVSSNNRNDRVSGNASSEDLQNRTMTTYIETGKTGQIQIPVGTDVETKLGTITTFSRLSNGDTIRMLLQKVDNGKEELLKIWIVE